MLAFDIKPGVEDMTGERVDGFFVGGKLLMSTQMLIALFSSHAVLGHLGARPCSQSSTMVIGLVAMLLYY